MTDLDTVCVVKYDVPAYTVERYSCCYKCWIGTKLFWHLLENHEMSVLDLKSFIQALDSEYEATH